MSTLSTMSINEIKNSLRSEISRILDMLPYAKVRAMLEDFNKNVDCNIYTVDDVIDELFKDNKLFDFLESIKEESSFSAKVTTTSAICANSSEEVKQDAHNEDVNKQNEVSTEEWRRREIMRYRQYASHTSKPGWIRVEVIESESGYGQKIDEVLYFPNKVYADGFRNAFNSANTETVTPNWYMFAI